MSSISFSPSKQTKKCGCGVPVARLTSWTRENLGRKFMGCKFYDPITDSRGCKFFEWVDHDGSEWQKDVINNLLLDKKLLKGENNELKREVEDLQGQRRCLLNENDTLKVKEKAFRSELKKKMKTSHHSGVVQVNGERNNVPFIVVSMCIMVMLLITLLMFKC